MLEWTEAARWRFLWTGWVYKRRWGIGREGKQRVVGTADGRNRAGGYGEDAGTRDGDREGGLSNRRGAIDMGAPDGCVGTKALVGGIERGVPGVRVGWAAASI